MPHPATDSTRPHGPDAILEVVAGHPAGATLGGLVLARKLRLSTRTPQRRLEWLVAEKH